MAKPIVKWVGGKSRLLKHILPKLPNEFNTYIEPFVGGGALFFNLAPKKAIINDINSELINLYKVILKDKVKYFEKLEEFKKMDSEKFFYEIRSLDREANFIKKHNSINRAARFVYLNKTCYGGLFRVNSKGHFNTPYAKVINGKKIIDKNNTKAAIKILKNSKIYNTDYKKILQKAKPGDFVFIDPPYLPWKTETTFTSYDKTSFGIKEHKELSKLIDKLTHNNIKVMVTNHATNLVKEIYKNLNFKKIKVTRTVSCDAKTKSGYYEYIMTNY